MTPLLINTLTGYAIPILLLLYVRWRGNAFHYVVLAAFCLFMATVGMGKLLPFFGHSVVGGSLYFPTALLSLTMLGHYSRNPGLLRRASGALMVGSFFLALGTARWVIFSLFGGEQTTHEYSTDYVLWYSSMIMIAKCYLATMIGVYAAHWRPKHEGMIVIPILIEVIVTTPLVLHAGWYVNPDFHKVWPAVIWWTFACRISLVLIVGVVLELAQRWFGDARVGSVQPVMLRDGQHDLGQERVVG